MSAQPDPTDDSIETVHIDDLRGSGVNVWDRLAGTDVTVPGHPMDQPDDALPLRIEYDDGDHAILLSSEMRTDPVEGTQGTYTVIRPTDDPCPDCGHEYERHAVDTLGGLRVVSCAVCGRVGRSP